MREKISIYSRVPAYLRRFLKPHVSMVFVSKDGRRTGSYAQVIAAAATTATTATGEVEVDARCGVHIRGSWPLELPSGEAVRLARQTARITQLCLIR
jgi:hypothetical protein